MLFFVVVLDAMIFKVFKLDRRVAWHGLDRAIAPQFFILTRCLAIKVSRVTCPTRRLVRSLAGYAPFA